MGQYLECQILGVLMVPISPLPVNVPNFTSQTAVHYWISRSYLSGVATSQLCWNYAIMVKTILAVPPWTCRGLVLSPLYTKATWVQYQTYLYSSLSGYKLSRLCCRWSDEIGHVIYLGIAMVNPLNSEQNGCFWDTCHWRDIQLAIFKIEENNGTEEVVDS